MPDPRFPAAICVAVGGFFLWDVKHQPTPELSQYVLAKGTVQSAVATASKGSDIWNVKVWLAEYPNFSFNLYQPVSGRDLGVGDGHKGAKVEMICLAQDFKAPQTGVFHSVDPFIEAVSLKFDGQSVTTWDDFLKFRKENGKLQLYVSIGLIGAGGFWFYSACRPKKKKW